MTIQNLLLNGDYEHPEPFGGALALATQPNYLGSPEVVSRLISEVMDVTVRHFEQLTIFDDVWSTVWAVSLKFARDEDYVRLPGWHTVAELGQTLLAAFRLEPEPFSELDLEYLISEALMGIHFKARAMLAAYMTDPAASWEKDALPHLNGLHQWAVTVFLGTNIVLYSGLDIADFKWKPEQLSA